MATQTGYSIQGDLTEACNCSSPCPVSYGALPIDTAFVGKASQNTVSMPEHGMEWSYSGKNATQGHFALQAR